MFIRVLRGKISHQLRRCTASGDATLFFERELSQIIRKFFVFFHLVSLWTNSRQFTGIHVIRVPTPSACGHNTPSCERSFSFSLIPLRVHPCPPWKKDNPQNTRNTRILNNWLRIWLIHLSPKGGHEVPLMNIITLCCVVQPTRLRRQSQTRRQPLPAR